MSEQLYDPQAPEGDKSSSDVYFSKKDLKVFAIGLVSLAVILYPFYQFGVRSSEKARCSANMKAMMDAMNLYAESKDDRFPPLYRTGNNREPGLGDTGKPYTWADDIQPLMNKRYSFQCPSAKPDELVSSEDPETSQSVLKTSYGMYAPYSGYTRSLIANPDTTAIVAETSNQGAQGTFDPVPLKDEKGNAVPDGMVIGWDDSNEEPSSASKFVTRLSYPETRNGDFKKDGISRHDAGIHVLTVTGERLTLPPSAARVEHRFGSIQGLWAPPLLRKT